ncbi:MAG: FAD-dependent monooxygenase [Advenella sp.]
MNLHTPSNTYDTDVIIIGGGPVGLALAAELGWRNNRCILLEQSDGIVKHPKMDGIDLRVMEFCRRWGLIDDMKNFSFPTNYPQDMVYVTSLAGYELGRESFAVPSGGAEIKNDGPSPETRIRCPQNFFDPILRKFADSFNSVSLRFNSKYLSFEEKDNGVHVQYENVLTGDKQTITGRYLVACDGANSIVREQLNIGFHGVGLHNYTTNVMFRCDDLFAYHDKRPGYRWLFIGPEGTYGTMSAINGRNEWRAQLFNDEKRKLSNEEIEAYLERMIGKPCDYEIISVLHWARRELVADKYNLGRIFMAGDACHATSPTGGFGMNTGIKDAIDLAWKLDATIKGWAGNNLLDTYDIERRPSGARAVREASGNWRRMMSPGYNPQLLNPDYEGALVRYEVGRRFSATMLREWYKLGIDLGYTYKDSPLCWPDNSPDVLDEIIQLSEIPAEDLPHGILSDGTRINATNLREWQRLSVHLNESTSINVEWEELTPAEVMVYRQTSKPGSRAPHVWLENGKSTLDWYGKGFVLLILDNEIPDTSNFVKIASECGLPVELIQCNEKDVARIYKRKLVLIRPDGHVAWRGNQWPSKGVKALIDRVRGA